MKNIRSYFVFNRSEQNGIFVLVAIIILLQLVYFFYPFSSEVEEDPKEKEVARQLQRSVDSLKQVATAQGGEPALAPFNPNFISDYKGYLLGMTVEQIDRLHEHRAKGQWVNSAEEFREITGISDSLLQLIEPAFKFPDFLWAAREENKPSKKTASAPITKGDLNTATAEELRKVNGIGEKLSARIVNYRNSLGSFRGNAQLKDVYGLSPEVTERLLQRFEVKSFAIEKLDVNAATVMQLVEIPYLNYEQARAIVKYRETTGRIETLQELLQIKNFPVDKIDRIELYLTIDREN